MINPTLFYVSIAAVILGFASGWGVRDWKADADQLKTVRQAEIMREKMQAKVDRLAVNYEEWRAAQEPAKVETRNTIREIYRDVKVPVECAAPVAVVGLLDAATHKANAAATGKPSTAVRAAPAATQSAD
jgi:hypothetical protein